MRHIALVHHYALRAIWAMLPGRAKVAVWKRHRANRKPLFK